MSQSTRAGLPARTSEIRRYVACGLIGFFMATFGTNFWLTNSYIGSRPRTPDIVLHLVYPMNDHGTYYYLSATESASLKLAFWGGMIAILLVVIVVPKDFIIPPPQTPRWITHVSASFRTGLEEFSLGYFAIMISALLASVAAIYLFGQEVAQFAAAHGIVTR